MADMTELHRMGSMSLYKEDLVISGGVYTKGVERYDTTTGTWDASFVDLPITGFLYGHSQVKLSYRGPGYNL